VLPYLQAEREDNPALGWRAVRMGLDRPALLRMQLRALIAAVAGRPLSVMFPLVASVEEFRPPAPWSTRGGMAWPGAPRAQSPGGGRDDRGAVPDLAPGRPPALTDFVSVGTNDLMQYLFARTGEPRVSERYDPLSPPALRALKTIRDACAESGTPVSVCGEIAGRPLEPSP